MSINAATTFRRLISAFAIVGMLTLAPMGCDDSTKKVATEQPPELVKSNNAMQDFVNKQAAEKKTK